MKEIKREILSYMLSFLLALFFVFEGIYFFEREFLKVEKREVEVFLPFEEKEKTLIKNSECDGGGVFLAPDGREYKYSYYLDVTATAYTHTGNATYMGTVAEVGVIAVDPKKIELGSSVYVIGEYGDFGVCRAEDIGGGIKGERIDVFLDSKKECSAFGRRKMRVYILEE